MTPINSISSRFITIDAAILPGLKRDIASGLRLAGQTFPLTKEGSELAASKLVGKWIKEERKDEPLFDENTKSKDGRRDNIDNDF